MLIKTQICYYTLQLPVLFFQCLQSPDFGHSHPCVFFLPVVKGLFRYSHLTYYFLYRRSALCFFRAKAICWSVYRFFMRVPPFFSPILANHSTSKLYSFLGVGQFVVIEINVVLHVACGMQLFSLDQEGSFCYRCLFNANFSSNPLG